MNCEKLRHFSYLTVSALGIGIGLYVFFKYLFFGILPFLIAWAVAFSVRPMATKLGEITRLPKRLVSAVIGLVSVLSILTLCIGVLIYASREAWDFVKGISEEEIMAILEKLLNPLSPFFETESSYQELWEKLGGAITSALTSAVGALVSFLGSFVSSAPGVLIFIVITALSTVYFCLDLEKINACVRALLPSVVSDKLTDVKNRFLVTLLRYLRSYLLLMLLTFIVMIFGFMIMKIPFAILLALVVALLDALPFIGVGTVLIPWGIFELIFGLSGRGIGLLVLFFVSFILRQLAEPKIVGKSLGIHPVISLIFLYVGYRFFGVLGLLFIPLGVALFEIFKESDAFKEKL